ncbi:MAG: hypothetical protein ABJN34_02805 [Litoreibacter sp.]|uniref:hypothetical protein n=1 Tax=Litoreibacter sp. TaxID=1969459 RepID=UPI00329A2DED
MRPNVKIATCCYCGTRTMLKPTARDGHELACGSCGAPLHDMKWLKTPQPSPSKSKQPARATSLKKAPTQRKRKQRKPFWHRAIEEVWDEIEDIFD